MAWMRPTLSKTSAARACAASMLVATLVACGGGGGSGTGGSSGGGVRALFVIDTPPPSAQLGLGYRHDFAASGGTPPYMWSLAPGSAPTPAGLALDALGRLTGTPTVRGDTILDLQVRDAGTMTAHAPIVVRVGLFDVTVSGLEDGEAWTGTAYQIFGSSLDPITSVIVLAGGSGSTATLDDPFDGFATIRVGATPGTDPVRVGVASGAVTEFVVSVVANPAPQMVAHFGTTDVWRVRFDEKEDASHAYASDFDKALVTLGLRAVASVGAAGTRSDRLARLLVRKRLCRHLGGCFRLAPDGTPTAAAPMISFPLSPPFGPLFKAPPAGTSIPGAKNTYNVIGVHAGPADGSFGYSVQEDTINSSIDDLASIPGRRRGVFLEAFTPRFQAQYANTVLPAAPIGPADEATLTALLYDGVPSDARATEIERIADGAGRILAGLLAHEIGHALGLQHPFGANGSLMDPLVGLNFAPTTPFTLSAGDLTTLQSILPGPGR